MVISHSSMTRVTFAEGSNIKIWKKKTDAPDSNWDKD